MKNFWLNKIDRALRALGYSVEIINIYTDKEKEALIMDEYLFVLRDGRDDCMPLSLEEMADYLVNYSRELKKAV